MLQQQHSYAATLQLGSFSSVIQAKHLHSAAVTAEDGLGGGDGLEAQQSTSSGCSWQYVRHYQLTAGFIQQQNML